MVVAERLVSRWDRRWRRCDNSYALRNVLVHLSKVFTDARRQDAALAAMHRTLSDPEYLVSAGMRIGLDDVLSGLRYVRRRLPTKLDLLDQTVPGSEYPDLCPPACHGYGGRVDSDPTAYLRIGDHRRR